MPQGQSVLIGIVERQRSCAVSSMKFEVNVPTTINIVHFAEAINICADPEVLAEELAFHGLQNDSQGVIALIMSLRPDQVVNNILERKKEVEKLCSVLGIKSESIDNRSVLIDRICASISNTRYPFRISSGIGFKVLHRYVEQIKYDGYSYDRNKALDCANKLEELIKDMYNLFIGRVLIDYLNGRELKTAKGILRAKSVKFGTRVSQLKRLEENVREGTPNGAPDELRRISGYTSIFPGADLQIVQDVSTIRGAYIAHRDHPDSNLTKRKCNELFDLVELFTDSCMDVMPQVIFPVHLGINEWGMRYIAYIEESDLDTKGKLRTDINKVEDGRILPEKCKRFYLLETYADFRPYQKAYCLYPHLSSAVFDPKIFYKDDLDRVGEHLE